MTQAPPDGRDGSSRGDGLFRRREQRVALLAHASQAIHRAQTSAQEPGRIRTVAELVTLTRLEAHTLAEVEAEAMRKLEADVRRFAEALRSEGMAPEVAVRRLKATLDPVVYSAREHDGGDDVEWRRAVAGDVVRWFVEAYYAA
jgi:hypothetical protein